MASYGTLDSQKKDEEANVACAVEDENRMEWEDNGTILGLVIDVAASHASNGMAAIVMILGANAIERGKRCRIGNLTGVHNLFESCLCEYSEAFLDCFPYVALSFLVLTASRDIIQKRLYYGMLKVSGVVDFTSTHPILDPLLIFVSVCYAHIVLHFCLLFHFSLNMMGVVDTADLDFERLRYRNRAVIALSFTTLIPATLFLVFAFLHYDIAKGLLPLSQYVHDVCGEDDEDCDDKAVAKAEATLKQLRVVTDHVAKSVVETDKKMADTTGLDFHAHCTEFRAACLAKSTKGAPGPRIVLTESLWPGQFLLRPNIDGPEAKGFRGFWGTFTAGSIVTLCLMMLYICYLMIDNIVRACISGCDHPQPFLRLFVDMAHLLVVGKITHCVCWSHYDAVRDFVHYRAVRAVFHRASSALEATPRTPDAVS